MDNKTKSSIHQMIDDALLDENDILTLAWIIIDFHYLTPLGRKELVDWEIPDDLYCLDIEVGIDEGKAYLHALLDAKKFRANELESILVFVKYFYLLSPIVTIERPHFLVSSNVRILNNSSAKKK